MLGIQREIVFMPYVAHAAIQLANDVRPKEKNVWHFIKQNDSIEYRWKFCNDFTYHVIAGVYRNAIDALQCAKQLYVSLFYELLWGGFSIADAGCRSYETRLFHDDLPEVNGYSGDESFFFWTKSCQGGMLGPGVFVVDQSINEFDEYKFVSGDITIILDTNLNFDNADAYYFSYCREAQEYFNTIMLAENASEYGMKMTIYCGLLEHLSENRDKEQDILCIIDELIEYVEGSSLSSEKKDSLKSFLNAGRKMSASQKCVTLCERYARHNYGGFTYKKIFSEAYSIRSAFSHGENCENRHSECADYIKFVVLDVVKNYMKEKENNKQRKQKRDINI